MKKLTLLFLFFIPVSVFGQSLTFDDLHKFNYQKKQAGPVLLSAFPAGDPVFSSPKTKATKTEFTFPKGGILQAWELPKMVNGKYIDRFNPHSTANTFESIAFGLAETAINFFRKK